MQKLLVAPDRKKGDERSNKRKCPDKIKNIIRFFSGD